MAYAEVGDLRLGNIPLPAGTVAQRAVDQAAEEIDAAIGFKYRTPIAVPVNIPTKSAIDSLIKQINVFLASGRLVLELSAGTENAALNAYAKYMIDEAAKTLCAIKDGAIVLDGVQPANTGATVQTGPVLVNQDSNSQVEDFYGKISNPVDKVLNPVAPWSPAGPYGYDPYGWGYRE